MGGIIMAILKSSVVQGSIRVTDTTYTNDLIISDTTAPTIATGDYLLLADTSEDNKILKGPSLNTANTTKWLTQAGTWTTPKASDVELGNVENIKLTTWTGSINLATLKGLTLSGSDAASYIAAFAGTTDASSSSEAAVTMAGGLAVAKSTYIGNKLYVGTPSATNTFPSQGIHVWDSRAADIAPNALDKGANFYFINKNQPHTSWSSGMYVRGWQANNYAAWCLVGPATDGDQSTAPLYVRTSKNASTWGSYRKIYDESNKPSKSDVGLSNVENTKLSTWTGTDKITTVGTITSGTWSGTAISVAKGGTGIATTDPHKVLIGPASGTAAAAPTWRVPLTSDIQPISIKTYTNYKCSANNEANACLYFGKVTINPTSGATYTWPAPWFIHYRIYVSTTETNTQGWYDCQFSASGSTINYYNYNNFYSTDYRPIYHHRLIYPKNGYSKYGAYFGVRVWSSRTPTTLARTYTIEILETRNCTIELFDAIKTQSNVYVTTDNVAASDIWYIADYTGTAVGLQESGDANNNDTAAGYMRDAGSSQTTVKVLDHVLYPFSLMLSSGDGIGYYPINATSKSTATNKTTIYAGVFDFTQPIYYYSTDATVSVNSQVRQDRLWLMYAINLSYSFNIGTTLTVGKDVYLVAEPLTATTAKIHNPTAIDAAASAQTTGGPITQTLPTIDDGYIYIRLGRAYANNCITLSAEHKVYECKKGTLREFIYEAELSWIDLGYFSYENNLVKAIYNVAKKNINKVIPIKFETSGTNFTFKAAAQEGECFGWLSTKPRTEETVTFTVVLNSLFPQNDSFGNVIRGGLYVWFFAEEEGRIVGTCNTILSPLQGNQDSWTSVGAFNLQPENWVQQNGVYKQTISIPVFFHQDMDYIMSLNTNNSIFLSSPSTYFEAAASAMLYAKIETEGVMTVYAVEKPDVLLPLDFHILGNSITTLTVYKEG